MEITLKDRFLGCIYGLAIGDALGYPVEFMKLASIKSILGNEGVTGFDCLRNPLISNNIEQPIGSYSDDTQMTIATANALINSKTDSLEEIMANIKREYIAWLDSPENNRAPGLSCTTGVKNLKQGYSWQNSGVKNAKGCGAAMRTAPIGLYFANEPRKIAQITEAVSRCTHNHPTATSSGIATAFLVNLALRTNNIQYFQTVAKGLWTNSNQEYRDKIAEVDALLNEDTEIALKKLGEGWRGHEAVAMALYCFLKSPTDYRKTVLAGVNIDGDSDSVASIAGAISGAYNGIQGIPQEWIEIENRDLLRETAEKLYEKSLEVKE